MGSPGYRNKALVCEWVSLRDPVGARSSLFLTTWVRIIFRCLLKSKPFLSTTKELRISGSGAGNMFLTRSLVILAHILIFKKMWYRDTMEYYSTTKKNEILPFAATWIHLEGVTLSEIS